MKFLLAPYSQAIIITTYKIKREYRENNRYSGRWLNTETVLEVGTEVRRFDRELVEGFHVLDQGKVGVGINLAANYLNVSIR
jgi:hypothetical protein